MPCEPMKEPVHSIKSLTMLRYFLIALTLNACTQKSDRRSSLTFQKQDGLVLVKSGDQTLLGYQYETKYPPVGVDSSYQRSAFIHPINSPHGQLLTRIQPSDHYHHYGIWNPWTHVLYNGDTLDFWNLHKRQGTVRFNQFDTIYSNDHLVKIKALEDHVVFNEKDEQVALREWKTILVHAPEKESYIIDIIIDLRCAASSAFKILQYRYGGFGWRTTEEWTPTTSEVLTSQGKTRDEADGTQARWCIIQGELGEDYGGMVMMSHPDNYNHPEPLRIWPSNSNNGEIFANFSPTKYADWELAPGGTYTLKYRLLVFNGQCTRETADTAWRIFAKSAPQNY